MANTESIVQHLRALGLSLYEARIYIGLLRHGAQNGNELSKTSGVPSSKVYSTVEKLIGVGIVHSLRQETTTQFVCIAPEELVARLRKQYSEPLDRLAEELPRLLTFEPPEAFLTVSGLSAVSQASRAIIDGAQREINLSLWGDDSACLRDAIAAAVDRGVRVFGMLYGEEVERLEGSWLRHSYEKIVAARVGGRMLTLVADASEALIARIPAAGTATAVRTRNSVLTLIVQEYLHHDLVLQRAQIKIGFDEWDRWWLADPDLRSTILGTTLDGGGNGPALVLPRE